MFPRYWWGSAIVRAVGGRHSDRAEIMIPIEATPLQAEATVLMLLVARGHALVWGFMTHDGGETLDWAAPVATVERWRSTRSTRLRSPMCAG